MSLQDRNTPEPAQFAWPLWLGLGVAIVLLAIPLAGSNLPATAMVTAVAPPMAAAPAATPTMAPASTAMTATPAPAATPTPPASTMTAKATPPAPATTTAAAVATTTAATVATATTPPATPAATPAAPAATTTTAATTTAATPAPATPAAIPPAAPAATTKVAQAAVDLTPDVAVDQLMAPGPLPDMVLGDAKAPITIVEYASMTCPHCAAFHKDTFPALKTKYIDTGKVRLVFREFPLDNLAAAVSQLARCLGPVRYFAFVGTMFDRQGEWHTGDNDLPKLQTISKEAGFTDDSFKKCVTDQDQLNKIKQTRQIADDKFQVNSTPTFFINGIKLKTGHDIQDFDAVISAIQK